METIENTPKKKIKSSTSSNPNIHWVHMTYLTH